MIGQKLAHYEIVAKIGSGGMGDVYRARDTKLDRDVALKVLPEAMAREPERRRRFEREAKAVAALKHPNIVTIYSVEEEKGTLYLTMELVEGKTLSEVTPNDGIPLGRFFDIALPLTDAVGAAHAAGITHRDLKPANIIVDPAGRVKVLDFGLAKLLQTDPENDKTVAGDSDTQPGMVLGTVSYMSPEQAEGKSVDHRSDVFSLGIVLYEMATGERPFKGDSSLSIMTSILRDEPVSITEIKRTLPNQLGRILDRCMTKDPSRRFQTAADIRNELESLKAEVSSDTARHRAVSLPRRQKPSKRMGAIAAGVVIIGLAVVFGSSLFRGSDGPAVQTAEANSSLAIFPFENLKDPADPDRMGQIMQELLITDLSGLEGVQVYSSQRLEDIQSQIGGEGRNTRAVATKAGARTMLTGSLSQLGDKWILTCQLVNVEGGTIIQSKRIDGSDLYTMVDRLTKEFHADLAVGEPAELNAKIPIAQKTSSSLEAFKHYLAGNDWLDSGNLDGAIEELDKAIEIDPNFGQAYYKRAIAKWWRDNRAGGGREDLEYLIENKLYASEKEKRMAETMIPITDFQWAAGLPLAEQLTKDYPDEKEAWYAYGEAQFHFPGEGKRRESLAAFERAVALDPDFELPYNHLLNLLWLEKRKDEAMALIDRRIAKEPENAQWHRYRVGFVIDMRPAAEAKAAIDEAFAVCKTDDDRAQLNSTVGLAYDGIGMLDKAEVYRRAAVELDPDSRTANLALFYTLFRQAKLDEAERLVRAELDRNPENNDAAKRLANLLALTRRFDEGRKLAEEFIAKSSDTAWYDERVRFAIWNGDEKTAADAIAQANEAVTTTDDRRRFNEEVAGAYFSTRQFNAALDFYTKAREADPDNEYPDMFAEIGSVYRRQGRYADAEKWFRRALAADPNSSDALFGMALIAGQRGNAAEVSDYMTKTAESIPLEYIGPYFRASQAIYEGDLDAARRELQTCLEDRTSESTKWNRLVSAYGPPWMYLRLGYFDEALELFKKMRAFDMAKRSSAAHIGLGTAYLFRGEHDNAKQVFLDGLEIGRAHGALFQGLAIVSYDQGDLANAERYIKQSLTKDRPDTDSRRVLAYIKAKQGAFDEALSAAQDAVAADSTRESLELLAWVKVASGIDIEGGIAAANQAMQIPRPRTGDLHRYYAMPASAEHALGLAYLEKGSPKRAVEYLQKAVAYQPNRASAKRDLERALEMASRQP